jgi:hypothetical protein
MENILNFIIGIFFVKANCKLAENPSGIANSAQPTLQTNWHMPLNGGVVFLSNQIKSNKKGWIKSGKIAVVR